MTDKLTQSEHKALHDKLGEDLAGFFARVHGVESPDDDTAEDADADDDDKAKL